MTSFSLVTSPTKWTVTTTTGAVLTVIAGDAESARVIAERRIGQTNPAGQTLGTPITVTPCRP